MKERDYQNLAPRGHNIRPTTGASIPISKKAIPFPEGLTRERVLWEILRQLEQIDTFAPSIRIGLLDVAARATGVYLAAAQDEIRPMAIEITVLPPSTEADRRLLATLSPPPVLTGFDPVASAAAFGGDTDTP